MTPWSSQSDDGFRIDGNQVVIILLGVVGLVSNLYWLLRERSIERSRETSHEWDEGAYRVREGSETETETARQAALNRATDAADVPVEELPDRIETLRDRIAEREARVEALRETVAEAWWAGVGTESDDSTPIRLADLTNADHDIARQVAIHAVKHDRGAVIAVGRVDGSVAVGVGESLMGELSADRVAGRITDLAGGGAGGSAEIATGGAGDGEAIAEAAVTVRQQILSELATA